MKFLLVIVCVALLWSVGVISVSAIDTPWIPLAPDSQESVEGDGATNEPDSGFTGSESNEPESNGSESNKTESTEGTEPSSTTEKAEADSVQKKPFAAEDETSGGCKSALNSPILVMITLIGVFAVLAKSQTQRRKENVCTTKE